MNPRKVNRISTGRKKFGINGIFIAVFMLGLMVAIAVFLMVVGNVDLSHIRERATNEDYNGDTEPDITTPIRDDFRAGRPLQLPTSAEDALFYHEDGGLFELPLVGATGWVAATSALHATASNDSDEIATLQPGTGFIIINDGGDWWQVRLADNTTGWVDWRRCFINLPDVLPSIVYNITNASASMFRTGGYALTGITGQPMYAARAFNERLGRYEYIVPALLPMARALHTAQQSAHEVGHTLVIYEAFRPLSAQTSLINAINTLMRNNTAVNNAFENTPWSLIWFVSTGVSPHQRGGAIDVTLARVNNIEVLQTGAYSFLRVTSHTEINTVTPMHEMSPSSAITETPRGITSGQIINETAHLTGPAMTGGIAYMQTLLAAAGFNPMSSLWWQFNHSPSVNLATSVDITGDFYTIAIYSIPPAR